MKDIVKVHFENLDQELLKQCLAKFYRIREHQRLRKKPATSELIDWIKALVAHGVDPGAFEEDIPFLGALIKKEQDVRLLTGTK
jgi:MoxR-like ATPase